MNPFKTSLVFGVLPVLFGNLGYLLAGHVGLWIGLIGAVCLNMAAHWWGETIICRLYGAQAIDETDQPELFAIIRALALRVSMPVPRVYLISEKTPNACAMGRHPQHSAIMVTTGLLDRLDHDELSGVMAHALACVRGQDTLAMTVAAALGVALSKIGSPESWRSVLTGRPPAQCEESREAAIAKGIEILVSPIALLLTHLPRSRRREFYADEVGAWMTGNPLALANALRQLETVNSDIPMRSQFPVMTPLFIVAPFAPGRWARLFDTHPLASERIAYLEALSPLRPSNVWAD